MFVNKTEIMIKKNLKNYSLLIPNSLLKTKIQNKISCRIDIFVCFLN